MKTFLLVAGALLLGLLLFSGRGRAVQGTSAPTYGRPQGLPAAALELLEAQPFLLDEPTVHEWRREKPLYDAGWLLVLRVGAELARPRQVYEPVLYVGGETAERASVQSAEEREVLVVLVPSARDARGGVALDPTSVPIWFGEPELPERVDAAHVARELARARDAGIGPAPKAPRLASLRARDPIHARNRFALESYVEDLVARYAPR